jgi:hypothetical protein
LKRRDALFAILPLLLLLFVLTGICYHKELSEIPQTIGMNLNKMTNFFNPTGLFTLSINSDDPGQLKCVDYFHGDTFPGTTLSNLIDSRNVSLRDLNADINFEGQICFTESGKPVLYIDTNGRKIKISSTDGQKISSTDGQQTIDMNGSAPKATMTFLDQ